VGIYLIFNEENVNVLIYRLNSGNDDAVPGRLFHISITTTSRLYYYSAFVYFHHVTRLLETKQYAGDILKKNCSSTVENIFYHPTLPFVTFGELSEEDCLIYVRVSTSSQRSVFPGGRRSKY